MSLKQKTLPPPFPPDRSGPENEPRTREPESRRAGVVIAVAGALLIALVAGEALAGTTIGGRGDDFMRGTGGNERLAGMGGDDRLYGFGGDDVLSGGAGGDELYGGPGRDALLGGAGDDFIEARDGQKDYVSCGPGRDVAGVDGIDSVARDCETVYVD